MRKSFYYAQMGWVTTSAGNAHVNRHGMSWFEVPDITLRSTAVVFRVFLCSDLGGRGYC